MAASTAARDVRDQRRVARRSRRSPCRRCRRGRSRRACRARVVSLSFLIAASSWALSRTSANPSTFGSAPSAGTSSTPNANSVPSQERSCASVGPSPVASFAALSNSRHELRPAREARAEREQLLPRRRALVDVGVEERGRRRREGLGGTPVGAGGTAAPALEEPPQPASTRRHESEGGARRAAAPEDRGDVESSCPHFIGRPSQDREQTAPRSGCHAQHLRAGLRSAARAPGLPRPARAPRLAARDAAPRRQHLGDRARRGGLPVPLPPGRGGAARRAPGPPERAHGRRLARARARRRARPSRAAARAAIRSRTGATSRRASSRSRPAARPTSSSTPTPASSEPASACPIATASGRSSASTTPSTTTTASGRPRASAVGRAPSGTRRECHLALAPAGLPPAPMVRAEPARASVPAAAPRRQVALAAGATWHSPSAGLPPAPWCEPSPPAAPCPRPRRRGQVALAAGATWHSPRGVSTTVEPCGAPMSSRSLLAVAAGAFGVSAGTGPLRRRHRGARARRAGAAGAHGALRRRLGRRAAAVLGDLSGSLGVARRGRAGGVRDLRAARRAGARGGPRATRSWLRA